jgi:tRNA pseudouridine38-40 synthase
VRTVGAVLEAVLLSLFRETVKVSCAGRTDTGVHATGQVVSFRTTRTFPFDRLALALNSELPHDLTVRETAIVDDGFSARFDALERTYVYAIFNRRPPSALLARNVYHVWAPLDLDAMREAAKYVVGEHDFRSFCGMLPDGGVTLRTVRSLELEARGDLIRVQISADGFLHRMVRTIVGTLIECGSGKRKPESSLDIVEARSRAAAGITAPARGLYLAGVRYPGGFDSYQEPPVFARSEP